LQSRSRRWHWHCLARHTLIGFRNEAALRTFLGDPRIADLWKEFDGFVGPHGHYTTTGPLAYRAVSLSAKTLRQAK
jgi:hypothetical protein